MFVRKNFIPGILGIGGHVHTPFTVSIKEGRNERVFMSLSTA